MLLHGRTLLFHSLCFLITDNSTGKFLDMPLDMPLYHQTRAIHHINHPTVLAAAYEKGHTPFVQFFRKTDGNDSDVARDMCMGAQNIYGRTNKLHKNGTRGGG